MTCFEKIRGIVSEVAGVPGADLPNEAAMQHVQLDSLDMAEVILEVEEAFDMIVDHEDEIHNLMDLMQRVEAQLECA